MFKKKKKDTDLPEKTPKYQIRPYERHWNNYGGYPVGKIICAFDTREELKKYVADNYVVVGTLGGDWTAKVPFGVAIETDKDGCICDYVYQYLFTQETLDKLKFVKTKATAKMCAHWGISYYAVGDNTFVSAKAAEYLDKALTTNLSANVTKGSDWPYYFDIGEKYVVSRTSSWFKYLFDTFGYLTPSTLQPYTGEDKEKEYKNQACNMAYIAKPF